MVMYSLTCPDNNKQVKQCLFNSFNKCTFKLTKF